MNKHIRGMLTFVIFTFAFVFMLLTSGETAEATVVVEKDESAVRTCATFQQAVETVNSREDIMAGDRIRFLVAGETYTGEVPAFTKRIDLEIAGNGSDAEFNINGKVHIKNISSVNIHDIDVRCDISIEDSEKAMAVTVERVNCFQILEIRNVQTCSIDGTKGNGSKSLLQTLSVKGSNNKKIRITKIKGIEAQGWDSFSRGMIFDYVECDLIEDVLLNNSQIYLTRSKIRKLSNSKVIYQGDHSSHQTMWVPNGIYMMNSVVEELAGCTVVAYNEASSQYNAAINTNSDSDSSFSTAIGTMKDCHLYGSSIGLVLGNHRCNVGTIDHCIITGGGIAVTEFDATGFGFAATIGNVTNGTVLFSVSDSPVTGNGTTKIEHDLVKAVGTVRVGTQSGKPLFDGYKHTGPPGYSWRNTNFLLPTQATPADLKPYVNYDNTFFYYLSYDNCKVIYHEGAGTKREGFDEYYNEEMPGGEACLVKAFNRYYIYGVDEEAIPSPMKWTEDPRGGGDVKTEGDPIIFFDQKQYDLYPKYQNVTTYQVEFETGEYGSKVETQQVFEEKAPKIPEEPTHPGAKFRGWYRDEDCTQSYDFSTSLYDPQAPGNTVKLFAKWELNQYTVTFNATANGGTKNISVPVTWGETVSVPTEEPEYARPDVKYFTGWYKTAKAKTAFDFNTAIRADTTIYAGFKYNKSTITIVMDGGTVEVCSPWKKNAADNIVYNGEADDRIDLPWAENATPTKGYMYTYDGLFEDPAFTQPFAFEDDIFVVPPTRSYYAKFTPKNYRVKYYGVSYKEYQKNTGVAPIKEESLPYGSSISYEPEEYAGRFKGWDPYYVYGSDTIAVTGWDGTVLAYEMRLFMTDNPKIVFYSDIAGTRMMEDAYVAEGSSLEDFAGRTVDKTDYNFVGWTTEPRTDGEYHYKETLPDEEKTEEDRDDYPYIGFFDFDSTMPDEDVNLYPVLVRDRLRVVLDARGGTLGTGDDGKPQSPEFTVDINEKLRMQGMNTATKQGYELDGWYTQNGVKWNEDWGVTSEYCSKDEQGNPIRTEEPEKNYYYYTVKLTAVWKMIPQEIDVEYDAGEHSSTAVPGGTVIFGNKVNLANAPTPEAGWVFTAWEDSSGGRHSAGEEFLFDDSKWGLLNNEGKLVFAARYDEKPIDCHTITFDTKGGSYIAPITQEVGSAIMKPKDPSRDGFLFTGWYPSIPDTMQNEDIICEAQWDKIARLHTISFETGGDSKIDSITEYEGMPITRPDDPVKEHYIFIGWSPEFPDVMPSKDTLFTATWEPAIYKVTFDANGGAFSNGKTQQVVSGIYDAVLSAPEDPTRKNYEFSGWEQDVPAHIPGDLTVKAAWTKTGSDDPDPEPTPTPTPTPDPTPDPGTDPDQKGTDGTAVGPGASAASADRAITTLKSDSDPAGAKYLPLQLKSVKQTKTSVTLTWKKQKNAVKYVIYGNRCGKKYKCRKLGQANGSTRKFSKVGGVKVKKGTAYKFIVVALDKNNCVVSTSTMIHVYTKGGKLTNHKAVKIKVKSGKKYKAVKSALSVKRGKSKQIKAAGVKAAKKKKYQKHVVMRYASSKPAVAAVNKKGVIKARKKGVCYIYAYSQNGIFKRIKVTVK